MNVKKHTANTRRLAFPFEHSSGFLFAFIFSHIFSSPVFYNMVHVCSQSIVEPSSNWIAW